MESLDAYLDALASAKPTPGGGSAAIIVAAMAAALVAMVARITAANPKHAEKRALATEIAGRADALRVELLQMRLQDEEAFAAVMAAQGDERQTALGRAARVPLKAVGLAVEIEQLILQARKLGNTVLESDLRCAAEFAMSSVSACAENVFINHRSMRNQRLVDAQSEELARHLNEGARLLAQLKASLLPQN